MTLILAWDNPGSCEPGAAKPVRGAAAGTHKAEEASKPDGPSAGCCTTQFLLNRINECCARGFGIGTLSLNLELLNDSRQLHPSPGDLNACINSHGLYNSFQFVLRLSPEVHRKIAALPHGIVEIPHDFDGIQAFSTYLHETIHWWQHVGSTIGLLLSLSYPAQAHANYTHLKKFLAAVGPKKSIYRLLETDGVKGTNDPATPRGLANVILNNYFDIECFRLLVTSSGLVQEVVDNPLFDSVGHSYAVAVGNIVLMLASMFDKSFRSIPDARSWEEPFASLRAQKQQGYYYGSDVRVAPIAAKEIFEGQARFAQLQFLYFASGGKLRWEEVNSKGMLHGEYGSAFKTFLSLAELPWPPTIDHPTVGLFLLLCDMAINPGAGFPMPLVVFKTFIEDLNPAIRFLFLCRAIPTRRPDVAKAITQYSRSEYAEVSEALSKPLLVDSPLAIAKKLADWMHENEAIASLMTEYRTFDYRAENLPIRVLFSHFLAFNSDKIAKPEFFCWPGAWMTGKRVSEAMATLFDRHSALFLDKEEDDGIFPRVFPDKDSALVQRTFESFYAFNVGYDLTRQWIFKAGPFEYEYRWLSSTATHAEFKTFADRHFHMAYEVHPDNFEII